METDARDAKGKEEILEEEIAAVDANVKTMEDFTSPEQLYEELITSVKKYHPSADLSLIEKAYRMADGADRKSVV